MPGSINAESLWVSFQLSRAKSQRFDTKAARLMPVMLEEAVYGLNQELADCSSQGGGLHNEKIAWHLN